jgi:hypothetical protein
MGGMERARGEKNPMKEAINVIVFLNSIVLFGEC